MSVLPYTRLRNNLHTFLPMKLEAQTVSQTSISFAIYCQIVKYTKLSVFRVSSNLPQILKRDTSLLLYKSIPTIALKNARIFS